MFRRGLRWWPRARIELARKASFVFFDGDTLTLALLALLFVGSAETICEIAKLLGRRKGLTVGLACLVHSNLLQETVFSAAPLPQRLSVSHDSDNV